MHEVRNVIMSLHKLYPGRGRRPPRGRVRLLLVPVRYPRDRGPGRRHHLLVLHPQAAGEGQEEEAPRHPGT